MVYVYLLVRVYADTSLLATHDMGSKVVRDIYRSLASYSPRVQPNGGVKLMTEGISSLRRACTIQ